MVKVTKKVAKELANYLNIDLRKVSLKTWMYALKVELEHGTEFSISNVTNNDLLMTAKIALAHLLEFPDYYQRLKKMEKDAKQFWKGKLKPNIFKSKKIT